MSKIVYTGIESSGKSLLLSKRAYEVMLRNRAWFKVTGIRRVMAFNTPMAPYFVKQINMCSIYMEFKHFDQVEHLQELDIFVDELIKFFPASGSASLSNEQLHFATQGAKSGIYLYGASQDFSQVHKQFRLLVNEVYVVKKLIGSRRPMKSAPPVKKIWGICLIWSVSPKSFKGDNASMEAQGMLPSFFFIRKEDTDRFDTSYKVPLTRLPNKTVRQQDLIGYDENGKEVYRKTLWI